MKTTIQNPEKLDQELLQFIKNNPSVYGLVFKDYKDGKIVYSDPSEHAIRHAKRDLELLRQRQEAINKRKEIAQGDFILRKNGDIDRVTVSTPWVQGGGHVGSLVYVSKSGFGSYSGSCGDRIEDFKSTDAMKEGGAWIFSDDRSGAGRGVNHKLFFKFWVEI